MCVRLYLYIHILIQKNFDQLACFYLDTWAYLLVKYNKFFTIQKFITAKIRCTAVQEDSVSRYHGVSIKSPLKPLEHHANTAPRGINLSGMTERDRTIRTRRICPNWFLEGQVNLCQGSLGQVSIVRLGFFNSIFFIFLGALSCIHDREVTSSLYSADSYRIPCNMNCVNLTH